jgi:membrane-associated phospholipid phosphatase
MGGWKRITDLDGSRTRWAFLTGVTLLLLPFLFLVLRILDPAYGRWIFLLTPLVVMGVFANPRGALLPWAVYVVGFLAFAELRMSSAEALFPARFEYAIALERLVFGGLVPNLTLQGAFYRPGQVSWLDLLTIVIHLSYFILPHALVLVLFLIKAPHFRRYIYALIAMTWASLIFSYLVPTAPPWLAAERGFLDPVFRIVQEVLASASPETFETGNRIVGENEVAAMPSVHTATACLVALGVSRFGRLGTGLGWGYAALMILSLMYLGEHYFVDGLAGLGFTLFFWWLFRRSEEHRSLV